MEDRKQDDKTELQADAVVIGGGLAGQSAAIHLARGGLRVICLEPRESFHNHNIVGESLDWSAPQLFAQLGLTMEDLVASGAATFKRHITVTGPDGSQQEYLPGAWLTERPWNVEIRTLHLDRMQVGEQAGLGQVIMIGVPVEPDSWRSNRCRVRGGGDRFIEAPFI